LFGEMQQVVQVDADLTASQSIRLCGGFFIEKGPNVRLGASVEQADDPVQMRELLLAALRCGRLRVLLLANEIDALGIALKSEMVPLNTAFEWLSDIGAWPFLDPEIGEGNGQ
jgi:hypothetical protein